MQREYYSICDRADQYRGTKLRYIFTSAIHGKGIQGPASDIKIMSDYMQNNKRRLNKIMAENTGHTIEEIERDTERDHFMSAEEALEYGLIDSLISKR